jgi:replicative DNA helicase
LLHRDSDLPENLCLIVAKNRHGRIGEVSTLAMYERSTLASLSLPSQV